ncbi:unnamed protein product [Urochloa humidicola]
MAIEAAGLSPPVAARRRRLTHPPLSSLPLHLRLLPGPSAPSRWLRRSSRRDGTRPPSSVLARRRRFFGRSLVPSHDAQLPTRAEFFAE